MSHPVTTTSILPHDHRDCVQTALQTAEQLCQRRGLRFTATRRRVLELVWDSHKPIGAYDILETLGRESASAAPPTVYRALDFLIEAGLVHRLDSLNAFVGCPDPASRHAGQFLICTCCRTVTELSDPEIEQLIAGKAAAGGFLAVRQVLEIEGLCNQCRTAPQSA
ncbi:MAG: transcriptional repressor [Gammaproteobacteria bacterium]|nr:transcriptional repressor [Gammaproteobacteria bacterium]MDH5302720.1 transcriptional repressor [Gammaproteobacteria bacterium]MDH5321891.1 transcriptional repressor [Gammaproteobacteria bacterium]